MNLPRAEYPRPQFARESWMILNGEWDFSFDIDVFDKKIIVPYPYESKLSGIEDKEFHEKVWYRKRFVIPNEMIGKQIILHFGAVDYECSLWVNGKYLLSHTGGHTGFEADITSALYCEENIITIEVKDSPFDLEMPRGKQFWEKESKSIFYTRTTGIWQSVWIEAVENTYLKRVFITPLLDDKAVKLEYEINGEDASEFNIAIIYEGIKVAEQVIQSPQKSGCIIIMLDQQMLRQWNFIEDLTWSPENPRLFDVELSLVKNKQIIDQVKSYFGMRKVAVDNGIFMLNNRPYFQKLILNQGYWEEGIMTAPTDEDYIKDILYVKEMGFNGVRIHQKIEDPRFLYHADRMGLLVWGEIAAAYVYSRKYVKRITDEWIEEIYRDYNHPCIIVWVPLNESWGIHEINYNKMEQSHSAAMVHLTKSLDTSRLVISNDGWEHTCSDLLTIHDYEANKDILACRYQSTEMVLQSLPAGRNLFSAGWKYQGQPIIISEFGGISYDEERQKGWGYSCANSGEEFVKIYYDVVSPLLESPVVQGFCYTQLADVEQETNGLLTYARKPKVDLSIIRKINEGEHI